MQPDRVSFDELYEAYRPALHLMEILLGVVPYCDHYSAIWAPGFRTYNLIIPNFLNLPDSIVSSRSSSVRAVSLGLFVASEASGCRYCTAHSASFALRRGLEKRTIDGSSRTDHEETIAAVARGLATDPHSYDPAAGEALREIFGDDDAEWIVLGVAMVGYLNKFMDSIGVELEQVAVDQVAELLSGTGWTPGKAGWAGSDSPTNPGSSGQIPVDSYKTKLGLLRHAVGMLKLEREWAEGIPRTVEALQPYVRDTYGWDDDLLLRIRNRRPAYALGVVLRENLDPERSALGIGRKALVGLVYASHVQNPYLIDRAEALARFAGVDDKLLQSVREVIAGAPMPADLDPRTVTALTLAKAMAPSPTLAEGSLVWSVAAELTSEEIAEAASWASINQLEHRLWLYLTGAT